ncbi:unnamed protein product [Periconia digitata]|uniref:Uncharacterized protein n=1 Tax=Periconia digitata TaxID=1303443 RepID=A0A9W4UTP5_9PLEO|nr:unnamed protein product [Periconia digitata]
MLIATRPRIITHRLFARSRWFFNTNPHKPIRPRATCCAAHRGIQTHDRASWKSSVATRCLSTPLSHSPPPSWTSCACVCCRMSTMTTTYHLDMHARVHAATRKHFCHRSLVQTDGLAWMDT